MVNFLRSILRVEYIIGAVVGLFVLFLIIYPLGRFLLEFLRLDASEVAGMNANQTLMALIIVASISVLLVRHRKHREDTEQT